jgi:NAD(P)-dependent dehydrogenase (short-subunit alcohol dehydrogenase family)
LELIEKLHGIITMLGSIEPVRAIVITGTGTAFSSGHDLKELTSHRNDSDRGREFFARTMTACSDLMLAIVRSPKPVIAAVNGIATAPLLTANTLIGNFMVTASTPGAGSVSFALTTKAGPVASITVVRGPGQNVPTVDYPIEEWERVLRVNLTSQFLCCRAVAPKMVKAKYGRIVNIASVAGKEGNPNAVAYSASKAGVISLTKSLGKELAQAGVLVNCVTPAAAKTAIFDQMTQQHIDFMLSKIPKNRFVLVEELAAMVAWLASEDCAFSTGAVFDISGGRATY